VFVQLDYVIVLKLITLEPIVIVQLNLVVDWSLIMMERLILAVEMVFAAVVYVNAILLNSLVMFVSAHSALVFLLALDVEAVIVMELAHVIMVILEMIVAFNVFMILVGFALVLA
jgi:hypothetical protein